MTNLEITTDLNYDYDLSQINFNDNFKILRYSSYNETSLSIYTQYEQLSSEYCNIDNINIKDTKFNRIMLIKAILEDDYYSYSDIKNDCINSLKELFIDGVYSRDYEDLESIEKYLTDRKIDYDLNYYVFETRGYSQGDYGEILVNIKEWETLTGANFLENVDSLQKEFGNLYWNVPISGNINISFDYYKDTVSYNYDNEFEFYEISNDSYKIKLDTDLILECIKKELIHDLKEHEYKTIIKELELIDYQDIES